jgi:uncharacterized protein
MTNKEKILADMKQAMKDQDVLKRETLRMLDSMIKNTEIEKGKKAEGLNDEEVLEVITRAVKQRKDSAAQYQSGGRADLADKENQEIEILMEYMPEQLGEEEVRNTVKNVIAATGATGKAQMGMVMGQAMKELKGKADGQLVRNIVEESLS